MQLIIHRRYHDRVLRLRLEDVCQSGERACGESLSFHFRVTAHQNRNGLKRDHSEVNSRMKGPESDPRVSFTCMARKTVGDGHLTAWNIWDLVHLVWMPTLRLYSKHCW